MTSDQSSHHHPLSTLGAARRGPFAVRLLPEFLSSVTAQGEQVAGLLFGSVRSGAQVDVQSFRAFDAGLTGTEEPDGLDRRFERSLKAARTHPDVAQLALVGWFTVRSHESTKTLLKDEIEFHNRFFTKTDDLVLVLRSEAGAQWRMELFAKPPQALLSSRNYRSGFALVPVGGPFLKAVEIVLGMKVDESIYLRTYNVVNSLEKGQRKQRWWMRGAKAISKDRLLPRISLKQSTGSLPEIKPMSTPPPSPAETAHDRVKRQNESPVGLPLVQEPAQLANEPPPIPERALARPPERLIVSAPETATKARSLLPLVAVFILTAGLTFSLLRFGLPVLAAVSRREPMPQPSATVDLGMRVESQGQLVMVSWHPALANLQASRGGILTIYDGARQRKVHLDAGQVVDGSVLYQPTSPNVVFHLEFRDNDGLPLEDSVRVLGGAKRAARRAPHTSRLEARVDGRPSNSRG